MSELETTPETSEVMQAVEEQIPLPDDKALLMQRAKLMGLKVSPNIGVKTLKARIKKALEQEEEEEPEIPAEPKPMSKPKKKRGLYQKVQEENMKLVRLRITNLDPKKKDLPGEIYTVSSKYLGTVRKFVPFGEVTENGYHVPYCIYKALKAKKFLNIRVIKGPKGERIEANYVPEFALEILPPLTQKELQKLATIQAAAAGNG